MTIRVCATLWCGFALGAYLNEHWPAYYLSIPVSAAPWALVELERWQVAGDDALKRQLRITTGSAFAAGLVGVWLFESHRL
jgi:hypothetical protein